MVIYLVIVSLLLVNMLIAMMANTYDTTNEHKREWIRQVKIEKKKLLALKLFNNLTFC